MESVLSKLPQLRRWNFEEIKNTARDVEPEAEDHYLPLYPSNPVARAIKCNIMRAKEGELRMSTLHITDHSPTLCDGKVTAPPLGCEMESGNVSEEMALATPAIFRLKEMVDRRDRPHPAYDLVDNGGTMQRNWTCRWSDFPTEASVVQGPGGWNRECLVLLDPTSNVTYLVRASTSRGDSSSRKRKRPSSSASPKDPSPPSTPRGSGGWERSTFMGLEVVGEGFHSASRSPPASPGVGSPSSINNGEWREVALALSKPTQLRLRDDTVIDLSRGEEGEEEGAHSALCVNYHPFPNPPKSKSDSLIVVLGWCHIAQLALAAGARYVRYSREGPGGKGRLQYGVQPKGALWSNLRAKLGAINATNRRSNFDAIG